MLIRPGLCMLLLVLYLFSPAQRPSAADQLIQLPNKFFSKVNSKIGKLDNQLTKQTEKYLRRLIKQEAKLKRKLSRIDTAAAKQLFTNSSASYEKLLNKMKNPDINTGALSGEYLPYLDSMLL